MYTTTITSVLAASHYVAYLTFDKHLSDAISGALIHICHACKHMYIYMYIIHSHTYTEVHELLNSSLSFLKTNASIETESKTNYLLFWFHQLLLKLHSTFTVGTN